MATPTFRCCPSWRAAVPWPSRTPASSAWRRRRIAPRTRSWPRSRTSAHLVGRDRGVGIRRDFLPHVFEAFRQAEASPTRIYGGLGLGLAIVKSFAELHGGSVSAESNGEGEGATFTVALPVA